ncbi:hypothetical protein MCHI_003694 [Candidatus Magnetoovum chiemensis]|nr:hypothetical protein MCHI_003694 [Candidatus Magnetoovum chiemensis]
MYINGSSKNDRGFLVIEILICGLILTSSIAATMYLFRVGYEALDKAEASNVIASKVPQAINILRSSDFKTAKSKIDLGDNTEMLWKAKNIGSDNFRKYTLTQGTNKFDIYLYEIAFSISYKTIKKEYTLNVFKFDRKYNSFEDVNLFE